MNTICNPTNINYRFSVEGVAPECFREAADPSVVFYRDQYWLFPSKSGGYWVSDDLIEWSFVATKLLPTEDYAPDVRVINDFIYFTASRREVNCPVYRTQRPGDDDWELVSEPMEYWDPNMFQDDDGRVYLYHGSTNRLPIYGLEMHPETMQPLSEEVALIPGNPQEHGWERLADNNEGMKAPWIEGAWINKHRGIYYLQYSSPGTDVNVYNDGVYESSSPLGPFECSAHNPFSFKPGGFMTGAGHGSTFQDRHGNWWHTSTMRLSVRHAFERRLGLWPAGFDRDGVMFCNTRFGDYPMRVPAGKWDPWQDAFAGWMLLSYRKPATASSAAAEHPPGDALNEDVRTFWAADNASMEQWLQVDLEDRCSVAAVQINFAEHHCRQFERQGEPLYHGYHLETSEDGDQWRVLPQKDAPSDSPHDYLELAEPVRARFIRLVIHHMPGQGWAAVSGLRVFGRGVGDAPAQPTGLKVVRDAEDPCIARISWTPVEGATGYHLRWGIAVEKLYLDWLLYEQNKLVLRSLSAKQDYWFSVEAFNANGVSPSAPPVQGCRP